MTTAIHTVPDIADRAEAAPAKQPRRFFSGRLGLGALAACGAVGLGLAATFIWPLVGASTTEIEPKTSGEASPSIVAAEEPGVVAMSADQQRAVGLKVGTATAGTAAEELTAPGRVAPDQGHFAFITARAPGVVRSVEVNIGQEVRAGDVLATIDSQEVGRARLELRTQSQLLEVARTEAEWQKEVYANTLELIDGLKRGDAPEEIQTRLGDRPVGAGRDLLMTAYAQYRLTSAALGRVNDLYKSGVVAIGRHQQAQSAYDAAAGSYQALLDSTGHEAKLANIRAQQALRQAETAVDVAREKLKILGVGLEEPTAAIAASSQASSASSVADESSLSTYALVAPFDGTILDRQLIVPGVSVDLTSRLFTLADLSTVWIEANVAEGDFEVLPHAGGGEVRFTSPAYPGREFAGRVLYRGDMVDEATRSIKLLAATDNAERLLKPGMYVDVLVRCPGEREAACVPDSALLTENEGSFVYVRTADDRFERRPVALGGLSEGVVAVVGGLEPGEEVVVEGASKLEAKLETTAQGSNG